LPVVSIILAFLLILANWYSVSWTGLPSPAYFPFSSIAGEALVPASFPLAVPKSPSSFAWLWNIFNPVSYLKEKTSTVTIPKYAAKPSDLSLSAALQYTPAVALPQLQQIMYEFTTKVYQPAYEDFTILVHTGNTDGLVLSTFQYSLPGKRQNDGIFLVGTELRQLYATKGKLSLFLSGRTHQHYIRLCPTLSLRHQ
jgi:hypothetical protein